jgi:CBS domain-containing protein
MGSSCSFCLVKYCSQGREEQLLLTDQDSILVFEDVATEKVQRGERLFS